MKADVDLSSSVEALDDSLLQQGFAKALQKSSPQKQGPRGLFIGSRRGLGGLEDH